MADKELVKLYNRISFYLCFTKKDEIKIDDNMKIKELKALLEEFYKKNKKNI